MRNVCTRFLSEWTGRRYIDVCNIASIQQSVRRPRECVASDSGPLCLQMRFQPPGALSERVWCIVVSFGVETRWSLVVSSTVGMLSHCSRDEVSPSVLVVLREEAPTGMFLHGRCEEYRLFSQEGGSAH